MTRFIALGLMLGFAFTGCDATQPAPRPEQAAEDPSPAERPRRDQILRQALACGFQQEDVDFSIDEEGVDNADLYPRGAADEAFRRKADCMMGWAAESGAAIGISFEPREQQN